MHLTGNCRCLSYSSKSRRVTHVVLKGNLAPAGAVLVTPVREVP